MRRAPLSAYVCLLVLSVGSSMSGAAEVSEEPAWFRLEPDLSDGPVTVFIHSNGAGVQGWSFGLAHDPAAVDLLWYRPTTELNTIRDGSPPSLLLTEEASGESSDGVTQAAILDFTEYRVLPTDAADGFPVLEVEYNATEPTTVRVAGGLKGSGEPVPIVITIDGATYNPLEEASMTVVPKPEAWFGIKPEVSNGHVTVFVNSADGGIQGWSYSLCHDSEKVVVDRHSMTPELATINHGNPPSFYHMEVADDGSQSGIIQAVVTAFTERIFLPGETEGGFPVLEVDYDVLEESPITFCPGLQGQGQPVALVVTIDGLTSRLPMQHAATTLIVDPYSETLAFRSEPPESNEVVTVKLYSEEAAVQGWSFTLCHTAAAAEVVELKTSPELEQLVNGEPPEFVLNDVSEVLPFSAVKQTVVLGTPQEPLALGPFPQGLSLLDIRYDVSAEDNLKFCDHVGSVTFDNFVTIDSINYIPRTRTGTSLVLGDLGSRFIRGDADLNGTVNLSDAVYVLSALFLGAGPLPCLDAADVNDVGRIDIADPIYLLRFLFLGGPPPLPPFPDPGVDLSPETAFGCERGL